MSCGQASRHIQGMVHTCQEAQRLSEVELEAVTFVERPGSHPPMFGKVIAVFKNIWIGRHHDQEER